MNKLINLGFGALVTSALLFSGCGKNAPKQEAPRGCVIKGEKAPMWVCLPSYQNSIAAVGVAKPNAGDDIAMQREEAMAVGRDALARQISLKVSNMFKRYVSTTGAGKASTYEKAVENVSKQIASQTLAGSKAVDMWQPKSGDLYLLVVAPTSSVKQGMDKAIKTSFKNDEALYQKFLADKAQGELDKELEKANK